MSTSSTEQGRGSHLVDNNQQTAAAITKADQMAWEAPELRQVFTREDDREPWAYPCPDWCTGDGKGHENWWATAHGRRHEGAPLRVRQDHALAYYDDFGEDGESGITAAHLEVRLIQGSRSAVGSQIKIDAHWGGESKHRTFSVAPLFPDEARELIAVLQHLLKVGQES